MCRILACPRMNLPEAVFLKRFAAPRWVFILGMVFLTTKSVLTTASSIGDGGGVRPGRAMVMRRDRCERATLPPRVRWSALRGRYRCGGGNIAVRPAR